MLRCHRSMKTILLTSLFFVFTAPKVYGQDFLIRFLEENYKEARAEFSYHPLIYHSVQVTSAAGPKVLLLKGEDAHYRRWVRQFIAQGSQFILKVPQEQTDAFIRAKIFETDVTALHPIDRETWKIDLPAKNKSMAAKGGNYILLVDADKTRTRLFKTVATKMGYKTLAFENSEKAYATFNLQPEKFKMIAIHHGAAGWSADAFVDRIIAVKPAIPVIIDTGYGNNEKKARMSQRFSKAGSVHIRPVLLNDLQNTIKRLIKSNA